MRKPRPSGPGSFPSIIPLALLVPVLALFMGCATVSEDAATHLVEHDMRAFEQDLTIIEGDLSLFRTCLSKRGGTCTGATTTAVPHSSQHHTSTPVGHTPTGNADSLADSVATLPIGHPAKSAHALLRHPITRMAAGLHDAIRGHDITGNPSLQVKEEHPHDGLPRSTITMDVGIRHAKEFQSRLLSSLSSGAWAALHRHCQDHLASEQGKADYADFVASCRQVTFIRGYLDAYVDNNHFIEVDVALSGTIRDINTGSQEVRNDIQSLFTDLQTLQQSAQAAESGGSAAGSGTALVTALQTAVTNINTLVSQIEPQISRDLDPSIAGSIERTADKIDRKAGELETLLGQEHPTGIETVAEDLDLLLGQLDGGLQQLENGIAGLGTSVVNLIDSGTDALDHDLSNVFRVSTVGFISRESTFRARLPTLEVTIDPTAQHLLTVTDLDTGQVLTSQTNLSDLGVAADLSGVGTGANIGAEVIRVFLEALFDAHEGLPAIAPANLANATPSGLFLSSSTPNAAPPTSGGSSGSSAPQTSSSTGGSTATAAVGPPTGTELGRFSLPLFQLGPDNPITASKLQKIIRTNDLVALNTKLLVGTEVSGFGPLGLNNPSLEAAITEVVTTSVRKATEKITWCWYTCELDTAIHDWQEAGKKTIEDELKKIGDELKSEEKKIADEITGGSHSHESGSGGSGSSGSGSGSTTHGGASSGSHGSAQSDAATGPWQERGAQEVRLRLRLKS